jgi:hypothetical protein
MKRKIGTTFQKFGTHSKMASLIRKVMVTPGLVDRPHQQQRSKLVTIKPKKNDDGATWIGASRFQLISLANRSHPVNLGRGKDAQIRSENQRASSAPACWPR